jgi:hypothetical protein
MGYQAHTAPNNQHKNNNNLMKALVAVVIVIVLVIGAVIVLRYVPLKYESKRYSETLTVEPQQTESRWFIVPEGYSASGTYSESSGNSAEVSVTFTTPSSLLGYRLFHKEGSSGSFSFDAQENVIDNRYTLSVKNPASSGFFGIGKGPTITVTVEFTVSGYTTYLK